MPRASTLFPRRVQSVGYDAALHAVTAKIRAVLKANEFIDVEDMLQKALVDHRVEWYCNVFLQLRAEKRRQRTVRFIVSRTGRWRGELVGALWQWHLLQANMYRRLAREDTPELTDLT